MTSLTGYRAGDMARRRAALNADTTAVDLAGLLAPDDLTLDSVLNPPVDDPGSSGPDEGCG